MHAINTKIVNVSEYWGVGILGLYMLEYWGVGIDLVGCRNSGFSRNEFQWSEYGVVGILGELPIFVGP